MEANRTVQSGLRYVPAIYTKAAKVLPMTSPCFREPARAYRGQAAHRFHSNGDFT